MDNQGVVLDNHKLEMLALWATPTVTLGINMHWKDSKTNDPTLGVF